MVPVLVFCLLSFCVGQYTLKIGGFFPFEGGWPVGGQNAPMAELAVDHVNAAGLLPNHTIVFFYNNSKCAPSPALNVAVWQFSNNPDLVGALGGGCSVETEPIALLGSVFKIPQISFGSTSPALSDKVKYPFFMRVCGSDANQGLAWLALARLNGWKRVATLASQETLHALLSQKFLEAAPAYGIEIAAAESFAGSTGVNMQQQLDNIEAKGVTIIFMACYVEDARMALTLVKNMTLLGKKEVVFVGTDAWMAGFDDTDLAYKRLINGHVGFVPAAGNSARREAVFEEYEGITGFSRSSFENNYVDFTYDAIWTFAYGLRWMLYDKPGAVLNPVIDEAWKTEYYWVLRNRTNFTGITLGTVIMDEYGDRTSPYALVNGQRDTVVTTKIWDPVSDSWTTVAPVIWPDNTTNTPKDSFPISIIYVERGILIAFIVLACVAFVIGPVVNVIFLIIFHKDDRVVASTPIFLVYILFGTMIALGVVWVISVDPTPATCVIPWWFAHTAFWIIFGCLFAKSARILYIFKMSEKVTSRSIRPITNNHLTLVVVFLVLCVWTYLAIWTGIERPVPIVYPDPINPTTVLVLACYVKNEWIIPLYAVEFAFLLVGAIIAYQINQIDILRAEMIRFNESNHMAICIYALMFVGLVLVPIIHWLDVQSNNTKYVLSCCGLLVASMTINAILFWPKWIDIINGKEERPPSSKAGSSVAGGSGTKSGDVSISVKASKVKTAQSTVD